MELKLYTLPTCSICSLAEKIMLEVATKCQIGCRIVNMATEEGLREGIAHEVGSVPSIAIDEDVIARGRLVSGDQLRREVQKRLECARSLGDSC